MKPDRRAPLHVPDVISTEHQAAYTADLLHELAMRSIQRCLAGEEADLREVYERVRKERER